MVWWMYTQHLGGLSDYGMAEREDSANACQWTGGVSRTCPRRSIKWGPPAWTWRYSKHLTMCTSLSMGRAILCSARPRLSFEVVADKVFCRSYEYILHVCRIGQWWVHWNAAQIARFAKSSVTNGSGPSLRVRVRVQTEPLPNWRSSSSIDPNYPLGYGSMGNSQPVWIGWVVSGSPSRSIYRFILCITVTKSLVNYHTYKTTNLWRSVSAHAKNGAVTVLLSLLPIKAASTSVMHNNDQVTGELPYLQDHKSLMLCWRSF